MSSKIALGTFAEAYKRNNRVGYATELAQEEVFDKNLLVNRGYFSQELLTRFQHFITYSELSEEDKKRIILESKLSTYLKKKERLLKQFGIEIIGDEEFAEGVLTALKKDEKSVRDLNNIIATAFLDIEYEILSSNNKYKTLKLTKDTVLRKDYDLS
jgi:ATP-dependent protease Clp ATPase subunit